MGNMTPPPALSFGCETWRVPASESTRPPQQHFPDPRGKGVGGRLLRSWQGARLGQVKDGPELGSPTGGFSLAACSPEAVHFGFQVVGLEPVKLVPLGLLGKGEFRDLLQVPARNGGG